MAIVSLGRLELAGDGLEPTPAQGHSQNTGRLERKVNNAINLA